MRLRMKALTNQSNESFCTLVAGLIVFVTALYGYKNNIYEVITLPFLLLFIANRNIAHSPLFFAGLILIFAPIVILGWQFVGNQKFIHLYMLLFMFMGTIYTQHKDDIMKFCAFLCLFTIFIGASIWKWSLPEFRSGDFLTFTVLSGSIFDFYAAIVEGLTSQTSTIKTTYQNILNPNAEMIRNLQTDSTLQQAELHHTETLLLLGKAMTYIALFTQTIIPISLGLFLYTKNKIWMNITHVFICEFILLAYYPTQVLGFGMLLCILGVILAHYYTPKYKKIYILLFILLILFDLPLHQMAIFDYNTTYISSY